MILAGATLIHLDPPGVERADLRVGEGKIVEVGPALSPVVGEELVDLGGLWLMPGLVVAHHHLYSALATGMPVPPGQPSSFADMLARVWWRLDSALDLEAVGISAEVGGLAALRAGVTTIVDHHASPGAITGSLEAIDGALGGLGLRRVLCYEVTDRGGPSRAAAGLAAHEGLLAAPRDGWRGVKLGLHASFTLSDQTIAAAGALARGAGVGVHVHAAEAPEDLARGCPVARLDRLGALLPGSVLAHGVHLSPVALRRADEAGCWMTHQPRSNMNNGVGHAPIQHFPERTALGTDGIGADLFAEMQAGFFRANEAGSGWTPARWCAALAGGARLAGESLGVPLGRLRVGCAADLVALDPCPGPPLRPDNLPAALLFRMSAAQVRHVWTAGIPRLWERQPLGLDALELDQRAQQAAARVWARMEAR